MADHADLSQSYAGLTFGIANTVSTVPGMVAGPLTAWILGGDTSLAAPWPLVFGAAAAVNFLGACLYCVYSQAHRVVELSLPSYIEGSSASV